MAQHFYDFNNYSAGAISSVASGEFTVQATPGGDWTYEIVDLGSGDMAMRIARTSTSHGLSIVRADDFEAAAGVDVEVYSEFTLNSTWDNNYFAGGFLTASNNSGYGIRFSVDSGPDAFRLGHTQTNGVNGTSIGTYYPMTNPTAGTVICTRIGCYDRSGTQMVRGKIWLKSDSEPGTWAWDAANSSVTDSLWPSVTALRTGDSPYTIFALGIGTSGDAAPSSGGGASPVAKIAQQLAA